MPSLRPTPPLAAGCCARCLPPPRLGRLGHHQRRGSGEAAVVVSHWLLVRGAFCCLRASCVCTLSVSTTRLDLYLLQDPRSQSRHPTSNIQYPSVIHQHFTATRFGVALRTFVDGLVVEAAPPLRQGHRRDVRRSSCRAPRAGGSSYARVDEMYIRLVSNSAPTWSSRCCFTACHF